MSADMSAFVMPETDPNDAKGLFIKFTLEPILDSAKSAEEGRPIYRDCEFVTIINPGDKLLTFKEKVQPKHKHRFAQQYAAWKNTQGGSAEYVSGTPLSAWPHITEGQRKELEYFNIVTVEHLANVADGNVASMMGVQGLKQAAQKWLDSMRSAAPLAKLTKENEDLRSTVAANQAQLAELAEKFETLLKSKR